MTDPTPRPERAADQSMSDYERAYRRETQYRLDREAHFRKVLDALQTDFDNVRLAVKAMAHDLESTRRELEAAKRLLRERGIDPDSGESS